MKSKILLTGSNGFVGSNLMKLNSSFNFIKFNTRNYNFPTLTNDFLAIIHCAGIAHDISGKIESNDYYKVNTDLTIKLYNDFLNSNIGVFIFFSSIKAVTDEDILNISEDIMPNPTSDYGKSKLLAENYILNHQDKSKRIFILRPSLIYGPNNKGNLELLFKYINFGLPWFIGKIDNKRSFCSIENIDFIITKFINDKSIPSGIYNVCDNDCISTNKLIDIISQSINKKVLKINLPISLINLFCNFGDLFNLPINSKSLKKLTSNLTLDNSKLKKYLKNELPINLTEGLSKSFKQY